MESRPADAARCALRAARRQQTPATGTEDTPRPTPRTPGPQHPAPSGRRPADAARAALREALAARRAAARPTEEDTGPDTPAPSTSTRGTSPEEATSEEQEHPERSHGPRDTGDPAHSGDLTSSRSAAPSDDDAVPSPDEPAHPATPTSSGEPTPCGTATPSDAPARPATTTPSDEPPTADPAPPADDHALPDRSAPPRPADAARAALRAALARRAAPEDPPRTRAAGPHTSEHLPTPPPATASRTATTAASATPETGASAEHPALARHAPARRTPAQHAASRADEVRQLRAGTFAPPADAEPERSPAEHPSPGNTPSAAHPDHGTSPHQPPDAPGPRPVSVPPAGPSPAAAAPRLPRTMATPHRDNEHRRTFPALPPTGEDRASFAETWWGQAWLTALEKGALDTARLARGRGYAEQGRVDAITVTPGSVLAYVQGSRPRPYRAEVRLPTLDDEDWDRFLRSAAERPAHIAALLDKELPRFLADCGVPLLPGPGDLDAHCSCPDRGRPCKHAAALCYQTARVLDTDPFALLLLRGRGERELLDALSRLNATRAARAAGERGPDPLPGVRASEVLARRRPLPPLPAPLPPPTHPGPPPAYPAAPGGPDPLALDQLATDAAARAHALLTTGRDPVGGLTLWQDAVRLAAARPGSGLTAATRSLYAALASATGRDTAELARAVAAWRQGGADALAVLEEPWDPPAGRFDRARPLLLAAGLPAFRPWRNRLTHPLGHRQLRLGRNGLWYAYDSEPGREDWWPRGTPDTDPVGALTGVPAPEHS